MRTYKCLSQQVFATSDYQLVPIRNEDRYQIMQWRNEQIYHLRQKEPLSSEKQDHYFENVVAKLFDQEQPDQILFSFLHNEECIGYGGLVHINWVDQNAEISFIMNTQLEKEHFHIHWRIYLGLIEQVAFEALSLHKVYTYAFDLRPQLYEALESVDYQREVVLKEHCLHGGEFRDVIIHSKVNSLSMRRMNASDKDLIFKWANDTETRNNSFTSSKITENEHHKWFFQKLGDPDAKYFIALWKGQEAGFIRFDRKEDHTLIGINIAPTYRGQKLSSSLLKMACRYYVSDTVSSLILAYIRSDNIASKRAFEGAGFIYRSKKNVEGHEALVYELSIK